MNQITTARLTLRRARIDDLDAVHEIMSNAEAMRFWSTPPYASIDETRDWLESMIDRSDDYLIELEGRVIGKAGCWRVPEIGFILHPDCWGRGFARKALEALIPQLLSRFPAAPLTADVDPRNAASLGLLKRLGFVETGRAKGTWTVGEEVCDSVFLALPGA